MKIKDNKGFKENPKNINLLGGSSFFNDIGSDMITPLLPFYITALGGGGIAIGLLSGLREGLASVLKIFGGWLSDRTGKRKIFIFLGYLISIIFRFLLVIATSWHQIISFVAFERFGKARDAPRDALISESTKRRGRGFSIQQMMDSSGAIIGTLIVLFLFWKFQPDFKSIILIASVISVFALLPLFFVKEPKIKKIRKSLFKGIKSLSKELKYFIFVAAIFTLGNFGLYMFLLLRAKELAGNLVIPLAMYVLFNVFYAVFVVPFGNLSDKIGRKKVLYMGYALFIALTIGFIYTSNLIYFAVLFSLYGLVYAITQANHRALVSDLCNELKGTGLGFYYFVTGLVTIPAGLIAGIFWDVSYTVMFSYLFFVAVVSLILLFFVKERR